MNKKYVGYLIIYMIAMLAITLIGTVAQFACIGDIMPIWHWRYSEVEAYSCTALLWALLPYEYVFMADALKSLQKLDEEETSE